MLKVEIPTLTDKVNFNKMHALLQIASKEGKISVGNDDQVFMDLRKNYGITQEVNILIPIPYVVSISSLPIEAYRTSSKELISNWNFTLPYFMFIDGGYKKFPRNFSVYPASEKDIKFLRSFGSDFTVTTLPDNFPAMSVETFLETRAGDDAPFEYKTYIRINSQAFTPETVHYDNLLPCYDPIREWFQQCFTKLGRAKNSFYPASYEPKKSFLQNYLIKDKE